MNPTWPSVAVPAAATEAGQGVIGASGRRRLESVDLLRGLVMVMALDHVRDWFTNAKFNPTDLTQATPALFLTRWVTHFCAPSFIFLAGAAAYLSMSHGKSRNELSVFLLTHGLWLVGLERTRAMALVLQLRLPRFHLGAGLVDGSPCQDWFSCLGPAILFLSWAERPLNAAGRWLVTFGRVRPAGALLR